jgi:hypothetical protein
MPVRPGAQRPTQSSDAGQPSSRTHTLARPYRDPLERRVRDPPSFAADADRADAAHPPSEHHMAAACRPDPLAGRGVQVDAAVPAAREGVGAEVEDPRRRARHRSFPLRRSRGRECDRDGEHQRAQPCGGQEDGGDGDADPAGGHPHDATARQEPERRNSVSLRALVRLSSQLGTDRWQLRRSARPRRSRPGGRGLRPRPGAAARRSPPGPGPRGPVLRR